MRMVAGQPRPVTCSSTVARDAPELLTSSMPTAATAVSATATYTSVTMPSEMMMARGRSRCGFLASSPAVEAASKPMKEKNTIEAAAPTPETP